MTCSDGRITRTHRGEYRVWISLNETECYDVASKFAYNDLFAKELHQYAAELHDLTGDL